MDRESENSISITISDARNPDAPSDDENGLPNLLDEENREEVKDDFVDNIGELMYDAEGRVQHPRSLRNFRTDEVDDLLKCGNNNCIAANYFSLLCLLTMEALPQKVYLNADLYGSIEIEFNNVFKFFKNKGESSVVFRGSCSSMGIGDWPIQLTQYIQKEKQNQPTTAWLDKYRSIKEKSCTEQARLFFGYNIHTAGLTVISNIKSKLNTQWPQGGAESFKNGETISGMLRAIRKNLWPAEV